MKELKVFQNSEFGKLEVLMIEGKEYFPASACARVLGYVNPRKAIIDHCKPHGVLKRDAWVQTGVKADGSAAMRNTPTNYITEGNLYRLIVSSKLPGAERFERWVFDEVLPTIRKKGGYLTLESARELIELTTTSVVSKVIQELVPLFSKKESSAVDTKAPEILKPTYYRKRSPSIIGRLDVDLRCEVEDMICCGQYTYLEIVEHLSRFGITLSMMSVQRYARRIQEANNL